MTPAPEAYLELLKSRLSFLDLLRAGHTDYVINDAALDYMREHALAGTLVHQLARHEQRRFAGKTAWMSHLEQLGLTGLQVTPDPVRVATEGALWGAVSAHGFLCVSGRARFSRTLRGGERPPETNKALRSRRNFGLADFGQCVMPSRQDNWAISQQDQLVSVSVCRISSTQSAGEPNPPSHFNSYHR